MCVQKFAKGLKTKSIFESIQFIIMGATIMDVIFYCGIQASSHNLSGSSNSGISYFSLLLAYIGLLFAGYDIVKLFYYPVASNHSYNKINNNSAQQNNESVYTRYATHGWKSSLRAKPGALPKLINTVYFFRFALLQLMIGSFQLNSGFVVTSLVVLNLVYVAFYVYSLIKYRDCIESKLTVAVNLILELFIFVFSLFTVVFEKDPLNKNYAADTSEMMQKSCIYLVLAMVVFQFVPLTMTVFREFTRSKNTQAAVGDVINMKVRKSKSKFNPKFF